MASSKQYRTRMPLRRYERDFSKKEVEEEIEVTGETLAQPVYADITVNPANIPLHPDADDPSTAATAAAKLCYPSEPYKAPSFMRRQSPVVRKVYRKRPGARGKFPGSR